MSSLRKWFRGLLFGSEGTPSESKEQMPPKPDSDVEIKKHEIKQCEATLHYQNGDTETRLCHEYKRDDRHFVLYTELAAGCLDTTIGEQLLDFAKDRVNYQTLAREPVVQRVGLAEYEITRSIEPEWCDRTNQWREWRYIVGIEELGLVDD